MALTKCKECGKEVSSRAKVCPHCGIKDPGIGAKEYTIGFFIFAVIIIILWLSFSSDEEISTSESAEATSTINQKPHFKYVSKKDFSDTWPLTVKGGSIRCVGSSKAVLFLANKKTYALNGAAYNYGKDNGYVISAIEGVWAEDKSLSSIKGKGFTPRINLSSLIDFGLTLCK